MPTSGLVGYWKMDNHTDTILYDSTSNANNLTKVGNPLLDQPSMAGYDKAIGFQNNPNDAFFISDTNQIGLDNMSELTISCWINHTLSDGVSGVIAGKWQIAGDNLSYLFYLNTNHYVTLKIAESDGTDGNAMAQGTTAIQSGLWAHVAGRASSATDGFKIFVNGAPEGFNLPYPGSISNRSSDFMVGKEPNPIAHPFKGLIDELAIWNKALSNIEISELVPTSTATPTRTKTPTQTKTPTNASSPSPNQVGENFWFYYK